jgi:hypothetical protein
LASGQSSAITTALAGQYIMDGFLNIQLPVPTRAILARSVAIVPCGMASIFLQDNLNFMVNFINSSIGFLLPFAFTPLVKYNCSEAYMGKFAASGFERWLLYIFAATVYFVNAYSMSAAGGGFFGSFVPGMEKGPMKNFYIVVEVLMQLLYFGWNANCILTPVHQPMTPLEDTRPQDPQFATMGTLS